MTEGGKGMTMGSRGLVSSRGLAFIKSTKAPRGMVFRCEYYICYRKLSVVLVLPFHPPSPNHHLAFSLFLPFAPSSRPARRPWFSVSRSLLQPGSSFVTLCGLFSLAITTLIRGRFAPGRKTLRVVKTRSAAALANELLRI